MRGATIAADADATVEAAIAALKGPAPGAVLPAIDAALKQSPNDARLWHLKGLVHRAEGRRELAIPALRRAVEFAPSQPMISHGLAGTLREAGLPSVDAYTHAMQLAPGNPDVMKGMVSALVAGRRSAEAIAGLNGALARSPLWAEGHALLSDLRWVAGEREGFARSFDEALAAHPGDIALRRRQIITLLHAEQYDRALASIAEGRRAVGDDPMFDANEAVIRAELGDIDRADALFAPLADLVDSSVQVRRIRHLLRAGRPAEASAVIDQWLPTDQAYMFWPYASAAWRMTSDTRWDWLEGDPRFVGIYDIADRLPALDTLAATLRELHTTGGQPLVQSVRGGTQTDGDLFQYVDPTLVALREAIRETVAEHAAQLPPHDPGHPLLGPPRSPIAFSGAWSVRLQAGGFHSNHVHPMGWISSALYIVLPADLGRDQAGWLALGEPRAHSMPLDLPPVRTVEPKPGRLVLFPSWMWHGTRPFGEGERMTVAFDVAVPRVRLG